MRIVLVTAAFAALCSIGCVETFHGPALAVGQTTVTSSTICLNGEVNGPDGDCVEQDSNNYGNYDVP